MRELEETLNLYFFAPFVKIRGLKNGEYFLIVSASTIRLSAGFFIALAEGIRRFVRHGKPSQSLLSLYLNFSLACKLEKRYFLRR